MTLSVTESPTVETAAVRPCDTQDCKSDATYAVTLEYKFSPTTGHGEEHTDRHREYRCGECVAAETAGEVVVAVGPWATVTMTTIGINRLEMAA